MANIQISGLTAVASLASGDVFALDQSVGNLSKKITTANLATAIVTTTNVTAAGALMDSELTSIADVKALNQSLVIGAAPVLDATNFTNLPSGSVSIGDSVGGGPFSNSVLWVNGSFALSSNARFTFDGFSLNFTGGTSSSTSSSSFGVSAGSGNSSSNNTSIGFLANQNSIGAGKTAVGALAGQSSNGASQVAIGEEAGYACVGNRAISIGYRANRGNTSSGIAIGDYALYGSSGAGNVAVGVNAQNSSSGSNNSGFGNRALLSNVGGNNNSTLGYGSGEGNSGSDIVALGYNAGKSNAQNNRLIIGFSNLPKFAGEAAAAAALPAAGANGVYLYWDTSVGANNTIKARP